MRHPIYYINIFLLTILFTLLPIRSAHAQAEAKVRCSMYFIDTVPDYARNELHVTWIVSEAPIGYDIVELRLTQDGKTVPEVGTNLYGRRYPMDAGEAYLDVTNLPAGKITLDAMLLDGSDSPCQDSDKGIWLAKKDEFEWKPPVVSYKVETFQTEHDKKLVSFNIIIVEQKYDVNYIAKITKGANEIGGTGLEAIAMGKNSERVEIELPSIDFENVKEAIPVKLHVEVWYIDSNHTPVPVDMDAEISTTPTGLIILLEKIGKVIMAVLTSPPAIAGIMLVLGGLMLIKIYSKDDKRAPKIEYGRPPKNAIIKQPLPSISQVSAKYPSFSVYIRQATASRHENVIAIDEFPCVFGRNKNLEHGQTIKNEEKLFINILHDANISREHFEIRERYNTLYIASRSMNGTKVNQEMVAKGEQVPLSLVNPTLVEIGEQTKIELKPA